VPPCIAGAVYAWRSGAVCATPGCRTARALATDRPGARRREVEKVEEGAAPIVPAEEPAPEEPAAVVEEAAPEPEEEKVIKAAPPPLGWALPHPGEAARCARRSRG
jgi:hypothetical protein